MHLTKRLLLVAVLIPIATTSAPAKRLPDLAFRDLADHPQRLSGLRGSIAVLSFWATWCAPCREELPRLAKLSQEYSAQGVRFLAISVDEQKDRPKIEPYLRQQNLILDVWLGANSDALDRLGLGNVVPATLILDPEGEVTARILGEAQEPDLRCPLDWLLHGRQGPAPAALTKRY